MSLMNLSYRYKTAGKEKVKVIEGAYRLFRPPAKKKKVIRANDEKNSTSTSSINSLLLLIFLLIFLDNATLRSLPGSS